MVVRAEGRETVPLFRTEREATRILPVGLDHTAREQITDRPA
jgi:hypothetical protein